MTDQDVILEEEFEDESIDEEIEEALDEGVDEDEDPIYGYILDVLHTIVDGQRQTASAFGQWLDIANEAPYRLDYETQISVLQSTREGEDVAAWVTGHMLVGLMEGQEYSSGTKMLEQVATATGRTVADLRQKYDTAKYWSPKVLKAILEHDDAQFLSWSHFDRARRGMETAEAEALVQDALDNTWSVREMERVRMERRDVAKGTSRDHLERKLEFAINALYSLLKEPVPAAIASEAQLFLTSLENFRASRQ